MKQATFVSMKELVFLKIAGYKKIYIGYIIFSRAISNNIALEREFFVLGLRPRTKNSRSRGYIVGYSPRKYDITHTYTKMLY